MSKYTVTLGQLIDGGFDIGLTNYPIFDESYRLALNHKIINHFRYREIGQETPSMFKYMINRTMNEIMPEINPLYESISSLNGVNLMDNYSMSETYSEEEKGSGTSQSQGNSKTTTESTDTNKGSSKTQSNDTPMGKIADIYSQEYATTTSQNTGSNTTTVNGTATGTDTTTTTSENDNARSFARKTTGKNNGQTYGEILYEMKNKILNVDMMVIEKLEPCFMQLW